MIRALDKKTGQVKWEYDIRKDGDQTQFHGDPLVTDKFLVIGTDGMMGHVYAFERGTGNVAWKHKVNGRGVASDIVRLADNVYFVTLANELICVDLNTGKLKWSFRSSYTGPDECLTCSSPATQEGRVIFGGMDGLVYALDSETGNLAWKRDLGAKVTTAATIKGNNVYVATAKRHIYLLSTDSGEVLGDIATEAVPWGHLIPGGDSLFAFLGEEVFAGFDLDLKKLRWSAEASKEWTSARPYIWRDLVLAGDRRQLVAFRSSDGSRAWSVQFPGVVRGIGTSSPDLLYIGTLRGPIYAHTPTAK